MKLSFKVWIFKRNYHCAWFSVKLVSLNNFAKNHIGILFKIFVYRQSVLSLSDMHPIGNIRHFSDRFSLMFLQKDNIRCDFCVCILFESCIRQTDSTNQISLVCKHLTDTFIMLVKCSCWCNKCHDSAIFQLVHSLNEKIIVQFICIVNFIFKAQITERNISDSNIKAVILKIIFLKALNCNIRIRIDFLCDSSRNTVVFDTV